MTTEREYPFKFAERCLYDYPENRAKLEGLRDRLMRLYESSTAGAQGWEAPDRGGVPGDPVAVRELKIITLEEEIHKLTERTEPIARLLFVLDAPALEDSSLEGMGTLIRLWYFGKVRRRKIAEKLGVSLRMVYKMREKAVELVRKYMKLRIGCAQNVHIFAGNP